MKTIQEWFYTGKDYEEGLLLLARFSKNRVLLQNLSRKKMQLKLEYELNKIAGINKQSEVKEPVKTNYSTIPRLLTSRVDPKDLPEHLRVFWEETAEKYRLSRGIHEQLKLMTAAGLRAPLIEQLENYRKEIRANWNVIDAWVSEQNEGVQPVKIDEKRISANRKYLSEGKKAVMTLFGAIRAKKLEAMQRRINELLSAGENFAPENQKELEALGLVFNV